MKIYDEDMNELTAPDLELGRLEEHSKPIIHRYVVDVEEQVHEEVIREYPSGGKDVEFVVDVEEQGHWEAVDEDGNVVECDTVIPDDAPKEQPIADSLPFYLYKLFTDEELAERAKQRVQEEIAGLKSALADSDYVHAKLMDELVSCTGITDILATFAAFRKEYADKLEERATLREKINALEEKE